MKNGLPAVQNMQRGARFRLGRQPSGERILSGSFARLQRSCMKTFPEQPVEKLVVGKTMLLLQFTDSEIGGDQIPVQAGEAVVIQILKIGAAHVFPEEAAEIFRLKRRNAGCLRKHDGTAVMLMGIGQNSVQPGLGTGTSGLIIAWHFVKKIPVKEIQKFKQIPLEGKQIAGTGELLQLHHVQKKFPEPPDIQLYFGIRTAAVDDKPEMVCAGKAGGEQFIRNLHQNRPVAGGRAAGRMDETGIDQQKLSGFQGDRLFEDCHDYCALQDIDNFDGFVPVTGRKAAVIRLDVKSDRLSMRDGNGLFFCCLCVIR